MICSRKCTFLIESPRAEVQTCRFILWSLCLVYANSNKFLDLNSHLQDPGDTRILHSSQITFCLVSRRVCLSLHHHNGTVLMFVDSFVWSCANKTVFRKTVDFALEGVSKVSFSGFTLWPTSPASQEFLNDRTPCWGTISVKPFSQDLGSRNRVWLEKKLTLGRAWWTHKSSCLDSSAYSFCLNSVDAFHPRILLQIQSQLKGLLLQLEFIVWICSSTHPLICSYFPLNRVTFPAPFGQTMGYSLNRLPGTTIHATIHTLIHT